MYGESFIVFFFKQKTAYDMRISDWSSDVCSSDLGRRNAFLQRTHVGGQGGLITHGRRNTAKKCGHFRTCLREAEDIVDEEEHVLAFLVAEIFSDGEARQSHASARARRFVHLAIDQRHLGTFADRIAVCILGDNARIEKFVIKVVALTSRSEEHTSELQSLMRTS